MINIFLNDIKYKVPNKWEELNLKQYCGLLQITENELITNEEKVIRILNILTNINKHDLRKIDMNDIKILENELNFLNKFEIKYDDPQLVVEHKNIFYGLIDLNKISFGEYIDLEEYKKDISKNLIKIFALLYRPIKKISYKENIFKRKIKSKLIKKYSTPYTYTLINDNEGDFENRIKEFETISVSVVYAVLVFFWSILNEYTTHTKSYSESKATQKKKMIIKKKQIMN